MIDVLMLLAFLSSISNSLLACYVTYESHKAHQKIDAFLKSFSVQLVPQPVADASIANSAPVAKA